MDTIEVIVFDFDNTLILDSETGIGSEELKHDVWCEVFPEVESNVLQEWLRTAKELTRAGKGDRTDVVDFVLGQMKWQQESISTESEARVSVYSQRVHEAILRIGLPLNVREALQSLSHSYSLYISSATPIDELERIVTALEIQPYITKVYGRPRSKEENLVRIINTTGLAPQQILVVDDQPVVAELAHHIGCKFIGVRTRAVPEWHMGTNHPVTISGLHELETTISFLLTKNTNQQ